MRQMGRLSDRARTSRPSPLAGEPFGVPRNTSSGDAIAKANLNWQTDRFPVRLWPGRTGHDAADRQNGLCRFLFVPIQPFDKDSLAMTKPRVFLTRTLPAAAMQRLNDCCDLRFHAGDSDMTDNQLKSQIGDADALICLLTNTIDESVLAAAPKLKIVSNYAVGYNNIDLAAATRHNVHVTNTPGVLTEATADLAWALLMSLSRRIVEGDRLVRTGAWKGWEPLQLLGKELSGSTLGLIGLGRIAKSVARRAAGFNMKLVAWNRSDVDAAELAQLGIEMMSVDDVCRHADFVSLHCALADETEHIINAERLQLIGNGGYLINTARGKCVDESALVRALETGVIAGAGLDVFEQEPKIHPGLMNLENVVMAPHLGSATVATRQKMADMVIDNVLAACGGTTPPNVVNR